MQTTKPLTAVSACLALETDIDEQIGANTARNSISILDATSQEPWPCNVLMSILGWSRMQSQSVLESCPEVIGDIVYVLDHATSTQPEYAAIIQEFYKDNMPVSKLAVRHKMGTGDVEKILVEVISHIRDSHLPSILTSGLRAWKQRQTKFYNEKYSDKISEPLNLVEGIGACEIAWLRANGYVTITDIIDGFRSESGILYDGKYITEETLKLIYEELEYLDILNAASRWGKDIPYRVAPRPATIKIAKSDSTAALPWPTNLWKTVITDEDAIPPEDLENTIDAAMTMLSAPVSKLLLYYYRDALPIEEIGTRLSMKAPAVYMRRTRAIDECQEPAVRRMFQYGLSETVRELEEFKLMSVSEMRHYSGVIVPLQSLQKKLRIRFAEQTVGDIIDYLEAETKVGNRPIGKQKELCTIYNGLSKIGVLKAYWEEGIDIKDPGQAFLTNKDAVLEELLDDLWGNSINETPDVYRISAPTDIMTRLHYAMGKLLTGEERQTLTDAYPVLFSRHSAVIDTELDTSGEAVPKEVVEPILEKLRSSPSLTPSLMSDGSKKPSSQNAPWPTNFMMKVFECESPKQLKDIIPVMPRDIEQAIDFILNDRFSPQTVKIIKLHFKESMTCRAAGKELNVSGAYVGSTVKSVVEKLRSDYDAKCYMQMGFALAKAGQQYLCENGAEPFVLDEPFTVLNLPQRVIKAFRRAGVVTVSDAIDALNGNWGGREVSGFGRGGKESTYAAMEASGVVELCKKTGRYVHKPENR